MPISLTLVMIVKNESKIINRCLSSILPIIDSIVITDTGSSDNTVDLIETFLKENKVKGKVYHDEWKNFGHNRSKSITNSQEWLKENNANLSTSYLITIDADMIFKIEPVFKKEMLSLKDSWCIQQKNPMMTYYNKRIFRSSLRYKCIGVTHEYWGCDDKEVDGKLESLYIDDIGDGGAKADKFERDIRLLTQGLIDEPKNERYYFYLAQSYSDAGNKQEAINLYKKRIEAGGWFEEIFIAYLRIGDIYIGLEQLENAIHYWSLAYDHLPTRSETLFRISHALRLKGKNNLAMIYIKTALPIVYPLDQVLFIEHTIYQYRLLEELSICGFYTKERPYGWIACEYLILKKGVPDQLKMQCYMNLFFYIQKLQNSSHSLLSFKTDQPYINSSASLIKTKKGYTGNIRAVNYSISKDFKYSIRDEKNRVKTKNYWVQLNDKGTMTKQYELEMGPLCSPKRESHINGLEDMRVCKFGDEWVALVVTFEYGSHNHPSICVCTFDKKDNGNLFISNISPTNYKENECQKNWAPFVENNKLYAIYSHHPLTIVEIDPKNGNTKVSIQKESTEYDLSKIRGSTSPIRLQNGSWLVLVHEVLLRDTRKYFHRFIIYDKDWNVQEISMGFYFNELFVEFSLSISIVNDVVTIFYSKEDNSTEMMTVSLLSVPWIPRDINKWIKETF